MKISSRGFTLIEIALVLVIVSLVLGAGLSVLRIQQENAKISATKEKQQGIRTALISFIARNNRLPCPAVATLASGAAGYGAEAATPGTCTGTTIITGGANGNARGVVPWVALGVADEATTDGYGRRFTYQVRLTATNLNNTTLSGMTGNINVHSAVPVAAGNQINPNDRAVAILISHGRNGNGAWNVGSGVQMVLPAGAEETENTDADRDFAQVAWSDSAANPFDDILLWIPPQDLLTPLQNSGSLKTVQGTLNERASVIKNALLGYISGDNADPDGISTGPPPAPGYRADWRRLPFADRATGGVCTGIANNGAADPDCTQGNIPWGTLGIAQTTATDPWGQFFRYTVTVDLAGAGTEPGGTGGMMLNSPAAATVAYTLVSAGADSTFGSADDVTLLSISVGELRGTLNNAGVPVDP